MDATRSKHVLVAASLLALGTSVGATRVMAQQPPAFGETTRGGMSWEDQLNRAREVRLAQRPDSGGLPPSPGLPRPSGDTAPPPPPAPSDLPPSPVAAPQPPSDLPPNPGTVPPTPAPTLPGAAAAEAVTSDLNALAPPTAPPTGGAGAGSIAASFANAANAPEGSALGLLGGRQAPAMLGDMLRTPVVRLLTEGSLRPPPGPVPPVPPTPPTPPGRGGQNGIYGRYIVPSVRGFKVSENQSPRPQDRFFGTFNFYSDVNGAINRRVGGIITSARVYREDFGFEKTFFQGDASIGVKFPVDTLSVNSRFRSLGGTNTTVGNLSIFGKYVLWWNQDKTSLISTGMMVTVPTGPSNFAGSPAASGFRDSAIQPFLAFLWSRDRFYAQGFTAVEIATDSRDVTLYYNDLGVGYFAYRNDEPTAFIRALAPTFELHVNTPLNHRGALRLNDPAGTPDVVDLTYGLNTYFKDRAILSLGVATPITGPRPFAYEVLALLNVYYGRSRAARTLAMTPPSL